MGYHLSDEGGIIEDARRLTLSQHLIEVALVNLQTVSLHHRCAEGRRLLLAHRGQLCLVTDEQQAVVMSLIHKLHQVVEQTSTAESCSPQPHIGYHRSLVHHEERVGVKIVVQTELTVNTGKSLLSVDAAMDGIGRSPTAQREHLGSPARRGKEHHLLAYLQQGTHDGSRKRGLSRTGTASQYHHCSCVGGKPNCCNILYFRDSMTITQKKIVSLHHAKVTILFEMRKKISNNSILAACVLVVLTLCLLSVWQPIHFQKEKEQRETAVKQRLMKIRTAEENYKRRHGTYTGDFATLIKGKWLDREMQYIPFSDNKRFSLSATTIVTKNGKQIPLMECGATYEEYLDGLNEDAIQQETDNANMEGRFPGLKIGDITTNNDNAGNW